MGNIEKAKAIILQIIKSNGGKFKGKTRLYKAFYFAHFVYAEKHRDELKELSDWRIVKMEHGPGIHDAPYLLDKLEFDGYVTMEKPQVEYESTRFELTNKEFNFQLEKSEIDAIEKAVKKIKSATGKRLSDITHEHSNAWKNADNGEELNIYNDLIDSETFDKIKEMDHISNVFREIKANEVQRSISNDS